MARHEAKHGGHGSVLSASTVKGDKVRNPQGENLGKIEEVMLDSESGRIAYAVLSFGGFMGMGDKLFAIPWEALQLHEEDEEFVLNVDKETLEEAPGFDKDNWPRFADRTWGEEIHDYYGYQPYWTSGASVGSTGSTGGTGRGTTGGTKTGGRRGTTGGTGTGGGSTNPRRES